MKLERMLHTLPTFGRQAGVWKNIRGWLFVLPAAVCIFFCILRPQVIGIIWSFFDMNGYNVGEFVGFDNYIRVFRDSLFSKALWNTCLYVIWSLVIGAGVPIVVAVVLNELVHCRKFFRFWVYFPSVLPSVAVMLLWYMIYYPDASGLLNMILGNFGIEPYVWLQDARWTILYIIISCTWSGAGATAIYYFAALQGVSRELYEAAIIDGAGFFMRFRTVTFPHISGVVLLFIIRQIIGVFSMMEQPLQMTDGGPNGASMTLGLLSYRYGFVSVRPQFALAIGVIMFLILMVFTCFYFVLDKRIEEDVS